MGTDEVKDFVKKNRFTNKITKSPRALAAFYKLLYKQFCRTCKDVTIRKILKDPKNLKLDHLCDDCHYIAQQTEIKTKKILR